MLEEHVFDDRPGGLPLVVADREQDRVAVLTVAPVALEQVVPDDHALGGLQLEAVLDDLPLPLPLQPLGDVVAFDQDVRGDVRRGLAVGAAKENPL